MEDKSTVYKGVKETDIVLQNEMIIESEFSIVGKTVYKPRETISFEKADNKCFTRHLSELAVKSSLRNEYPEECASYIFSGFDGSLVEYIASKHQSGLAEDEVFGDSEVYEAASSAEAINSIPATMTTIGPRFH